MSLKLVSLNIESNKHLERVVPFLESQDADIVFLFEANQHDIPMFEEKLGMKGFFAPLQYVQTIKDHPVHDVYGTLVLTKHKIKNVRMITYANDKTPVAHNRSLLVAEIETEQGVITAIGTHFTWTPDGEVSAEQETSLLSMLSFLKEYPNFFLCGDFNAPRGKGIYDKLATEFTDCMPSEIETTIDPQYHRNQKIRFVVDTVFTKGDHKAENVKVVDGLSDHMAIVCDVLRN